jgi:Ca2+/Na+ antiporter
MDEKTTRTIRARVYIAFAVIALILVFVFTGTVRRAAMGILAVYCVIMAVVNFRKAKDDPDKNP